MPSRWCQVKFEEMEAGIREDKGHVPGRGRDQGCGEWSEVRLRGGQIGAHKVLQTRWRNWVLSWGQRQNN